MNGTFDIKVPFGLFLAIFIFLLGIGCETPGSTGSNIDNSEISVSDTTVYIPSTSVVSVNAFSGGYTHFSAGIFNDPLFGQIKATTLIKPALPSFSDSITANTTMKLRLSYETSKINGDSLAQANFELIEIDELWRAKAWKYDDQVPLSNNSPVASFSISEKDSIEVSLSQAWIDKYGEIYNNTDSSERDSLHQFEFFGLAIVPQNNAKVIPFKVTSTEFVIERPNDTTVVRPSDWATSLERSSHPPSQLTGTSLFSTFENVTSFKMDMTAEEFGTSVNISRVELVVPVDLESMNESLNQESNSTGRPDFDFARLHLLEPGILSDALDPGSPITSGNYSEVDSSFHFNITSFVNSTIVDGVDEKERFYITLSINNGVLKSALLFNENAPAVKRPRLIVTSINSEEL